ncbi:MAG TPA: hypothetical protein VH814_23850 [Steroidobacteraceae bacterium]|jgi:membrane-bound metal-dependent hydrolase YbcI (DUF457 family)
MPFTPFHFGPGALVHAAAPKSISFLAFCGANVLVDVEPLYFMLTGGYPLHRFFHTYVGATVAGLLFVALFALVRRFALPLLRILRLDDLRVRAVAIGAFAGTYSHVVLDSLMHADMRPLAPFSDDNALLRMVSVETLHAYCLIAGALGVAALAARRYFRS